MFNITIHDIEAASNAVNWCTEQGFEDWDLQARWPNDGYVFIFNKEFDLVSFALRWA
jgi:hypothetical protein